VIASARTTPPNAPAPSTVEGTLERVTFRNDENGYTVGRLQPRDKGYTVTVVGHLPDAQVGELLRLWGRWVDHATHGRQFEVARYQALLPATVDGIRRYLGSGLIKGIGPVMAKRITDEFGPRTLEIIEQRPERLEQVPGLGRKRAALIRKAWVEQQRIKDLMLFLQEHDVGPGVAIRIYKHYGDEALDVVRQQPYRLADEVYGIGFRTADALARSLGLAPDAPERLAAGLRFALSEAAADGHCFLPWDELLDQATLLLQVGREQIAAALCDSHARDEIHVEAIGDVQAVYLLPFYRAEIGIVGSLRELLATPSRIVPAFASTDWPRAFAGLAARDGLQLTPRQQEAVRMALTAKVGILTGGPGTGKTTILRTLIQALDKRGFKYLLASPTGRAAKRLSEATGAPASTIHRMLEFAPHGGAQFRRSRDYPLDADIVIVDEVSMLDALLANHLLKAVPPHAHLLLVGDVDQLPSVGPGSVLRDVLTSQRLPAVQLDTIFRQASQSGIIANAHRINNGEPPQLQGLHDFFFFKRAQPEGCAELLVELVAERIPRRFGLDPRRDIQVLSPTHRGPAGVANLNLLLQAALNPPERDRAEKSFGATTFRVGDRVMQQRNNYDLDVYNGDVGTVIAIDPVDQLLTVRYDEEREIAYDWGLLDELALAYAVSVHKAQGAEYAAVVLPLLLQHQPLLQRNLLYTGVTRAKQLVVLTGDARAVAAAVRNNDTVKRYTGLCWHLGR
jgi:exodeoxyribonuclease V alpha subunit